MTTLLRRCAAPFAALLLALLLGACSQAPAPAVPAAPVASLTAPTSVAYGDVVLLDAGGSSGDDLAYAWSVVYAPSGAAPLLPAGGSSSGFTPSASGTYIVRVEISNAGGSDSALASVVVTPRDVTGDWAFTFDASPPVTYPVTITQDGLLLGGIIDAGGGTIYPIAGSIDGDSVSLVVAGLAVEATLSGSGTSMSGTFSGSSSGSFSAARVP